MEKDFRSAVFIGRFQPFHNSHKKLIEHGLELADTAVIVVGSIDAARSIKNPWSFQERKQMILESMDKPDRARVLVTGVRDYFYNYEAWLREVQSRVRRELPDIEDTDICLLGHFKDASSGYLNSFPQWQHMPGGSDLNMHATDVRSDLFEHGAAISTGPSDHRDHWYQKVPQTVRKFVSDWCRTPAFEQLKAEYEWLKNEKAKWPKTPYPVVFTTVDTIVIKSGHVLVVNRKFHPGKGLRALPGGFVKPDESLEQAAIRELKQETKIKVDAVVLKDKITHSEVFDYPDRDLRGRTITHAFVIDLGCGELPDVKGGDDAKKAEWIPFREVVENMDQFYADHAHIISYLVMDKKWT